MIRIAIWDNHAVITIPIYREWSSATGPVREVYVWTDHHWGKGVPKI